MIRTKKFENLPQITSISPSGKIVVTENGVDKVISFEDFSNLPATNDIWNNASTTFTAYEVNVTDIQSAADSKLLDLKVNTTSKFVVRKDGNLGIGVTNPAARLDISDTVLAGSGSLAGSALNLAQTWNTTGNPTAIKLNVTNTASGAASNLLDLQVNGTSKLRVNKDGLIYFPALYSPNKPYIGPFGSYGLIMFGEDLDIYASYSLRLNGNPQVTGFLQFGRDSNDLHPRLIKDADRIIGQRNGVNPQSFRIYNTYTSATNFERLNLSWDTNVLKIGTEKGSAGGTARAMELQTDGATRMTITSTGLVGIGTTNPTASLDIQGASSGIFLGRSDSEKYIYIVTSPSTGYTANSFAIWNGITAAWAGLIMQFTENAALIFNRDIQNAYTNIRGANVSEPALNITQTSTGDFLSAGTFRVAKNGNLGIGTTTPLSRLDIAETWNGSAIAVTGASGTGSVATITFSTQSAAIPIGSTIVVASINPAGYNGTFVVTASSATSVSYANATTTTYVLGGTVQQLFTAVKLNVTDTASNAGSNLLDLQVGGASKFKIDKSGRLYLPSRYTFGYAFYDIATDGGARHSFGNGGGAHYMGGVDYGNCAALSDFIGICNYPIGEQNQQSFPTLARTDVRLYRDAAGTFAQRNGVNPQAFRLYGTYTDASNYARLAISCDTSGNAILATEGLGTGAAGSISINGLTVGLGKASISTNIAIGTSSLITNTTGSRNISIGQSALNNNTTGRENTAVGYFALIYNGTGNENTTIGSQSLFHSNGSNNVALGYLAGTFISGGGNNNASNGNIYIGSDSRALATAQSNQIVIGTSAIGIGSNSVVLGNDSVLTTALKGSVGIGTTTPSNKLEVVGGTVLFGNAADTTGTSQNGDLTLRAYQFPQLKLIANIHTGSDFFGLKLQLNDTLLGGILLNIPTGEIKIGGFWNGGYFPTFYSNNAEVMRISASGNVGIGTTTPAARLDIADTTLASSGSLAGSVLNLAQTWNTTGAPTAIKLNVTNTASGAASNLLDLQVGTVSQFKVDKVGDVTLGQRLKNTYNQIYLSPNNVDALIAFTSQVRTLMPLGFSNNGDFNDTFLRRRGVANLQLGSVDAAAPVAQTLSVQSVAAGTTNTAGANFTIDGSQGTGTGIGGSIVFRTAAAGSSGSTVNSLATAMTINSARQALFASGVANAPGIAFSNELQTGIYEQSGGVQFSSVATNAFGIRHQIRVNGALPFGFASGTPAETGLDVALWRDASNILALRNGVNPQEFRLYNTYTDANTFERLNIKWDTNVLKIGTEKGSSGGTARSMELQTDGATRMAIASDGLVSIMPNLSQTANGTGFRLYDNNAGAYLEINQQYGDFALRTTYGNQRFAFYAVNSLIASFANSIAYFNGTGNFGIGTTTPASKLDIADTTLAGSGSLAGSILNLAQTWNTTGAPTAIKLNVTNTASGAASNLLDLQVGGVSQFNITKSGKLNIGIYGANIDTTNPYYTSLNGYFGNIIRQSSGGWFSIVPALVIDGGNAPFDTALTRGGIANLQIGGDDAAVPVAQTLSVQSVVAGTTNTAGANFTIDGSQGTGTGAGGSIIFRTAKATTSSSTVNSLTEAMSINSNGLITLLQAQTGTGGLDLNGYGLISSFDWQLRNVNGFIGIGASFAVADTRLYRDAANILALRNGVNPQAFRLYNTYTDATTFERLNIKWDTNVLKIGTEKGASGGTARAIQFQIDDLTRMTLTGTGIGIGTNSPSAKLNIESTLTNTIGSADSSMMFGQAGTTYCAFRLNTDGSFNIDSKLGTWNANPSLTILRTGNVGIGIAAPTEKLDVAGNLKVSGHFSATTKSFLIPHPTKPDKKLQYACLEGPENGVYIRGKTNEPIILLPDYWSELVDADSITVTVTPIGKPQQLFVVSQNSTSVEIGNVDGLYNYLIFAERKDVNKLQTEI
jgi:hypothetical protein